MTALLGTDSEQPTEESKLRKAQLLRAQRLIESLHDNLPLLRTRFATSRLPVTDDQSGSGSGIQAD